MIAAEMLTAEKSLREQVAALTDQLVQASRPGSVDYADVQTSELFHPVNGYDYRATSIANDVAALTELAAVASRLATDLLYRAAGTHVATH